MYPVRYIADYVRERNRWTTFFRLLLVIPWYIVASVYIFCAFVVAFIAWFAIVFAGRYPEGLYNFNAGVLRFLGRFMGFTFLQTDAWPSFGFAHDPGYPIRVEIDPPPERYSRWKAFFRLILGIPVMFMLYLLSYLYQLGSVVAWFHIVFMGRSSGGIHNVLTVGVAYQLRANSYFLLLTETLPPVSDQAPAGNLGPGTGAAVAARSTQPA